eukprot:2363116-Prymnesium_polylepis.1
MTTAESSSTWHAPKWWPKSWPAPRRGNLAAEDELKARFQAASALFARFDADADGRLNAGEYERLLVNTNCIAIRSIDVLMRLKMGYKVQQTIAPGARSPLRRVSPKRTLRFRQQQTARQLFDADADGLLSVHEFVALESNSTCIDAAATLTWLR